MCKAGTGEWKLMNEPGDGKRNMILQFDVEKGSFDKIKFSGSNKCDVLINPQLLWKEEKLETQENIYIYIYKSEVTRKKPTENCIISELHI